MRAADGQQRMREIDEAVGALRLARRGADGVEGWIRSVRQLVGLPVGELAERLKVGDSGVFRMEDSERRGVIEVGTLRRAAEALGCDLVYGFVPRAGTLEQMASELEAARAQQRADALHRRRERAWRKRHGIPLDAERPRSGIEKLKKEIRKQLRKAGLRVRPHKSTRLSDHEAERRRLFGTEG